MNGILQDCTMILTPLLMISVGESDTSGIMAGASLRQIVSRFARAAAALCTVCPLVGASAQVKQVVLVTLD